MHPENYDDFKQTPSSKYRNLNSISRVIRPDLSNLFKAWADVSQINYYSRGNDDSHSDAGLRRRSFGIPSVEKSLDLYYDIFEKQDDKTILLEEFPLNVSVLLNEENKWGCFYVFPEYYADIYSPVVCIRELEDVPELQGGILTKDMVTACLTYLRRTPILGDYVYIKLDLCAKGLTNIDVLRYYKFLVYLELTSNRLTELKVLSNLLYLQYLSVGFNNLTTILEYSPAQWFLTEVHYKYNSVKKINDLSAFWSITILDLSHNNIKWISGLETLKYLRRLDLSFNHIQCLENLNHLRLLWLDVSYNNISSFELGPKVGLWTLLHLEYLNLNENNLVSLKLLSGCNRLRELHLRNNRFGGLLELAVYMKKLRRLVVLDLRANPICSLPGYREVIIDICPLLLTLDSQELEPVTQRNFKMHLIPDITTLATRRLLRLLYIQQLSRAVVSPFVPPADTTDVPIVIIVGLEAVGKGSLARRLATECSSNIELARRHTTAVHHLSDHYIEITPQRFDKMIVDGELLTYSEMDGQCYGLSREEAYVKEGKVKIVTMALEEALMLKLRGYQPYLILATMINKKEFLRRLNIRKDMKSFQHDHKQRISSAETSFIEHATLQVLLSGRIMVTGILNEIIMDLPDEKGKNEFVLDPDISLTLDSDIRRSLERYRDLESDLSMTCDLSKIDPTKQGDTSLYSLFKESPVDEYSSFYFQGSFQSKSISSQGNYDNTGRPSSFSQHKSGDFNKQAAIVNRKGVKGPEVGWLCCGLERVYVAKYHRKARLRFLTWVENGLSAFAVDACKSSKSVTFTVTDSTQRTEGMFIEPQRPTPDDNIRSISSKAPWPSPGQHTRPSARLSIDDSELWLAFLTEARQNQASELNDEFSDTGRHPKEQPNQQSVIDQLPQYAAIESNNNLEAMESLTTSHIRENYEDIHQKNPGLFWDTVSMDDPDKAFKKLRNIIRDIVKRQNFATPMFDIDFANMSEYSMYEEKLNKIRNEIAPQQLFY